MVLTPQQVERCTGQPQPALQLQQQSLGLTTSSDTAAMNASQRQALLLKAELIEQQLHQRRHEAWPTSTPNAWKT
ncbi:MAG: hypothetical protein R2857_03780 [Vampirovibrionales bacterium]